MAEITDLLFTRSLNPYMNGLQAGEKNVSKGIDKGTINNSTNKIGIPISTTIMNLFFRVWFFSYANNLTKPQTIHNKMKQAIKGNNMQISNL